jgi:drug/metabolite transporter (DMT)-like permease
LVALAVDVAYFHTALSTAQLLGMACILTAVIANQRGWRLTPAASDAGQRPAGGSGK